MRRKAVSVMLAFILAVMPLGNVFAEETLETEKAIALWSEGDSGELPESTQGIDTETSEEELQDGLAGQPGYETKLEENQPEGAELISDGLPDGEIAAADISEGIEEAFVADIEEIVSAEDMTADGQDIIVEEAVMEPLSESGIAELADFPLFSFFSNTEYVTSYGSQLEGDAKTVYDLMESACTELETNSAEYTGENAESLPVISFDLEESFQYSLTQEEFDNKANVKPAGYTENLPLLMAPLQAAYDAYIFDHPEAFWMGAPALTSIKVSYSAVEDGHIATVSGGFISIKEAYSGFVSKIPNYNTAVQSVTREIRNGLAEEASRQDILLAIHDYLCDTLTYDHNYSTYSNTSEEYKYVHSAAGAFLDEAHKVVCDGYAKAFKILLNEFGIECAVIPGVAGEPHAWNYVKMEDGSWYLVDVTWDDTNDIKTYRYFLLGSQTIPSGRTIPVGEARTAYTCFSSRDYSASFAVPVLNPEIYHLEHIWVDYVSNGDATCLEDGTKTAACDREGCGETNTIIDEGSSPGQHQWTNYISNGDATCLEDGTKTAVCDRGNCGERNTITDEGSSLGHQWTNYVSNGDATCLKDGTKTAICDRAGCTVTNTIADVGSRLPATITLNVSSIPLKVKQTTTKVTVSGLAPGDSVISWKSSKPKVASVNTKTGKITAKKAGTARITVTLLSGKTASFTVKVQKSTVKTKKISGISGKLTLNKKAKLRLSPVLTPITSRQKVTYCSSNKKVATVSKKGLITAKKAGRTTITIKSGSKTVKCRVTVR